LFTRWFHRWALLGGWAVGMAMSLWMLWITPNVATGKEHLGGPLFPLAKWFGADTKATIWTGLVTLAVNILVSIILTIVLRAIKADPGVDTTDDTDYHVEAGDPGVEAEPVAAGRPRRRSHSSPAATTTTNGRDLDASGSGPRPGRIKIRRYGARALGRGSSG
jgi:hypothetical protein